jgi:cytochrome c-type biogenesis protein CcmH/NrfG
MDLLTMNRRTLIVVIAIAASSIASAAVLRMLLQPAAPAAATTPGAPADTRPLDRMAERLAKRLAKGGGSAADWALLGRSYREMGRWPEAAHAFERSLALASDADVEADLAVARQRMAAR